MKKTQIPTILGAIAGDVIGSVYEHKNLKSTHFDLYNSSCIFTDDTILTIAVADTLLHQKDFAKTIWKYGNEYPDYGYGGNFRNWLESEDLLPYGSYGNGSAMRVSPVGFFYDDLQNVLEVAKKSAEVTHNHPEGIKGAQAVAVAVFLARTGSSKQEIKEYITSNFDYDLDFTLDEIRENYEFDVSCQGSVPQSIRAFLESSDFESAIRLGISIGGDSDTVACIAGSIATAFYKEIPQEITDFVLDKLPKNFIELIEKFDAYIASKSYQSIVKSALFGIAVGDALGVPVEFHSREELKENPVKEMIGFGTYNQPAGTWSDDSSLSFCLAEGLCQPYSLQKISENFEKWYYENHWTPHGEVFDIGIATRLAIKKLANVDSPVDAGGTDEKSNGNGSLMRILPLLFYLKDKEINQRFERVREISSITHAHVRSVIACFYYIEFALKLLENQDKFEIYEKLKSEIPEFLRHISIFQDEIKIFDRLFNQNISELDESKIQSSGYVLHTLEASIWCLLNSNSFEETVLKAVNLGEDTDTTGAVVGGLAGLLYGWERIPSIWIQSLANYKEIENLAEQLADATDLN